MVKYVYDFCEGSKEMLDLLGGKGANLAEMTNLGLPVPPGFTITTEACQTFLTTGSAPPGLHHEISEHLARLERDMGKKLGDPADPLLVSVRSGAKFSMPGMMDTVLDVGLNDSSVEGLAKQSGDERFAWDSYRRLVQMFAKTVLGVDGGLFEQALSELKQEKQAATDLDLEVEDLQKLVSIYKDIVRKETGHRFPVSPRDQLDAAILAVFNSWNGERARIYRRQERIPNDLGTAVTVVAMVFGNLNLSSGTGVAFTRDPATGNPGVYGDYLQDAQGEDVVAGIRNTMPLQELEELNEPAYNEIAGHNGHPGAPLPGPMRYRVHRREREAVDVADPGGQAHRRRRFPDRHPARGRGRDIDGRGLRPRERGRPGRADVPSFRRTGHGCPPGHRYGRQPGSRRRQGRSSTRKLPWPKRQRAKR